MASGDQVLLAVRLDILQDLISDIKNSSVLKMLFKDKVLENMVLVVKDNDAAFAELKNINLSESYMLDIREEMMRILEGHVKKNI